MATIETAYYVPTFLGLSTTFGISCAVSAACIIAFEICKRSESMKCLFSPRTQLIKNPIPEQSTHVFSWITATFNLTESEYIEKVGLDATMHIRFLRMAVHFLTLLSTLICPILLVIHWQGASASLDTSDIASEFTTLAKNETSRSEITASSLQNFYGGYPMIKNNDTIDHFRSNSTLYYLSIANIPNKNPIVWVHVLFIYIISLLWLWLLFVNHIHHTDLIQKQPITEKLHERSVLVTHIPHHLRDKALLKQHFERTEVGVVDRVTLVSNTVIKLLEKLLKKRNKTIDCLETCLIQMARIAQKQRNHPKQKDIDWFESLAFIIEHADESSLAQKVEKVKNFITIILELDSGIARLRDATLSSEYYVPTATAFVTFKSARSAQICAQIVTSWKPGVFDTRLAPEPRDILWRSLLRRGRKSRVAGIVRQWIVFAAVWSLTIFWLFPITFVLGLTSIQSLSNHLPFLRQFLASSFAVRSFIQNILPTLLVTLFMSLLPWIVLEISKQQDFVCYSELEDAVLGRYYHFAIFNVLIVFLLGSTFLTTMLDVIYEPTMLIQLLANSLPQGANFFLNYILFNSSTHAMELIQLGSQLFGHLILTQPIFSKTPRMRQRYTSPWSFPFYYYYPCHILVLVITLTYSVIQPLIFIFALFYFSFALIVYRHQYMYCYIRKYETNGSRHYRRVARYTSDGLLIFQFTMVGLLYLKGVLAAATTILPLIVFTVWIKVKCNRLFQDRTKHPYIGKFHHATTLDSTLTQDSKKTWKVYWHSIDDIWKFSYIKAWWKSGRYAQSSNDHVAEMDALERQIRLSTSVGQSDVTTVVASESVFQPKRSCSTEDVVDTTISTKEDFYHEEMKRRYSASNRVESKQVCHDLTTYAEDSKSLHETYEHPALVTPLISQLMLPLQPNLHYWNLKNCVYISLESVRSVFDVHIKEN